MKILFQTKGSELGELTATIIADNGEEHRLCQAKKLYAFLWENERKTILREPTHRIKLKRKLREKNVPYNREDTTKNLKKLLR